MEDRLERLEVLVEVLIEEVRGLRSLLEGFLEKKGRKARQAVSVERLEVKDLSKDELELLEAFLKWMKSRWKWWKVSYDLGEREGYDSKRGLVFLHKRTMKEFFQLISELGYGKPEALRLLGGLKILKYWERDGKRQYCIAVRLTKPVRSVASGYYVVDYERMKEVALELKEVLGIEGKASERREELSFSSAIGVDE
jgi:hypothetical protein